MHQLRDMFGNRLADNNMPLDRIKKLMGHKTVEKTLALYGKTELCSKQKNCSPCECQVVRVSCGSIELINSQKDSRQFVDFYYLNRHIIQGGLS